MLRIALVTNNPPPYRIPVFERLGRMPGVIFQVIFCSKREPNRHWDLPPMNFDHVFLRERYITVKERYIHNNPDVFSALKRFGPDVVVTDGFYPTQLYAFVYTLMKEVAHVPLTDGTDISERALSKIHKIIRRLVYARSGAFLSASVGGDRLYQGYGIPPERCFKTHLCIDNDAYMHAADQGEKFDFVFCGRIEPAKGPDFALSVAAETAKRLGRRTKILYVGSGSQEQSVRAAALQQSELVDATFHGFASQKELPSLYRSARVFLFPTHADVWGVVANEACAAGLPVIVSPHAGVAGELILDGQNGFVRELDAGHWAECAMPLLTRQELWDRFSRRSLSLVSDYTFDKAALGFLDACRFSLSSADLCKVRMPI
jgi:glycosyltransferase involved in cell wall biosynthesis